MLKYLIVALLAFVPALSVYGATPAAEQHAPSHAIQPTQKARPLTAAQRRVRLEGRKRKRAVKRARARKTVVRKTGTHRTVRHRVVRRHRAAHRTLAQRRAAHRAYERHLAHERWLRRHRAYEVRLRRERHARHVAYEHRLAARRATAHRTANRETAHRAEPGRAGTAKAASDPHGGMEVAKADVPNGGPRVLAGVTHATGLDYVSHEHVRLYWRSPLRGTHASLVRQNERDRAEGLTRIRDEEQLVAMVRGHSLIPLPLGENVQADPRLAQDRRYTRPWTAEFLRELGRAYVHRFGDPLVITSAVRPATYQRRLTWRNGNAAPANGEIASPHEFGATIDIGKKGMTAREKAWMRGYLLPLQQAGQIDVEEEFYQACFHITVYKNYVPAPMARPQPEVAASQVDADAR